MQNMDCKDFIKTLHEGKMISQPGVKLHVNKALTTGDCSGLFDFINKNRFVLAQAKNNIARAQYHELDNPYQYPHRNDVQRFLSGPLTLGWVNQYDDMFGISPDDLCLPVIIPGRVGAGKSNLIKYLLTQALSNSGDYNIIIPDLKGEYRHLLSESNNLKILTKDMIRLGTLVAPSWMTPMEFALFWAKVFTRENWLASTSESVLITTLKYIFKARGIFDGSQNWPGMSDLYYVIHNRLNKEKSFRYSDVLKLILNRLDPYIHSEYFNCRAGLPHDLWLNENIVLEMDKGFTDNMYSFIISFISGLRYTYNLNNRLIGSKLRTLILVDEGRILFRPRDIVDFGETYIAEIITKTREFGIGYIIASQETSSFSQTVRSISFLKICFPLTDGSDVDFVEASFGLTEEQAAYLFKLPRHGQAIVRYGGYEKPFILAVPQFKLDRIVTDEEIETRMAGFYADLRSQMKTQAKSEPVHTVQSMPPAASSLLYFLSKNPFTRVSDMTEAAGFNSPAVINKTLNWLEEHGFAVTEFNKVRKKGRKSKFAVLTQKAYAHLNTKAPAGKGNFQHKLYQHIISENQRKNGSDAIIEGKIPGSQKVIDVLAGNMERGFIAYEVTLHFENILKNVHKDIESGASQVEIVTKDNADMEKAIRIVNEDVDLNQYRDRIIFHPISDFFS